MNRSIIAELPTSTFDMKHFDDLFKKAIFRAIFLVRASVMDRNVCFF